MKILIPLDGSTYCMNAVNTAIEYAKFKGADVYLLHVVLLYSSFDLEISASAREKLSDKLIKNGEAFLKTAEELFNSNGLNIKGKEVITSNSIADAILDYSEKLGIDLIIMSNRGAGASTRLSLGSVSAAVMRHANCSVYMVKC